MQVCKEKDQFWCWQTFTVKIFPQFILPIVLWTEWVIMLMNFSIKKHNIAWDARKSDYCQFYNNYFLQLTLFVVVAQLVEQSLSTSKVHGSNPVIGKLLYRTFVYCQLCWKDEKEAENGTFTKTSVWKTMMQKWGVKISTHFWWNILRRSVHVLPSRRNLATCHRAWEQNWTELNRHLLKRKILFFSVKIFRKRVKNLNKSQF